jgi:hypothetical protein
VSPWEAFSSFTSVALHAMASGPKCLAPSGVTWLVRAPVAADDETIDRRVLLQAGQMVRPYAS